MTVNKAQQNNIEMRALIVKVWLERKAALGYKGKKADIAALDYLTGVRVGLVAAKVVFDDDKTIVDNLLWTVACGGCKLLEGWNK